MQRLILLAAEFDAAGQDGAGEIGPDRQREFGLGLGMGGDFGVVMQALGRGVEGLAADPLNFRARPEVGKPLREGGRVRRRGGGRGRGGEGERKGEGAQGRLEGHSPERIGDLRAIVHCLQA